MVIETMNQRDCLKLHGEIDADDNARVRFQEVVAPEIEVPLFEGINKQPFHDDITTLISASL